VRLTSRASSDEGTRYAQNTTQAQNGRLLYAGLTLVLFYRIAVARLPLSQWWDIALMLAATTLAWFVLMLRHDFPVWPGWLTSILSPGIAVVDERIRRVRASLDASLFMVLFCSFCLDASFRLVYLRAPVKSMWDLSLLFFATVLVGAYRNLKRAPPTWSAARRGAPRMLAAFTAALVLVSLAGDGPLSARFVSGFIGGAIGVAIYLAMVWWNDREATG
jgi:hypothetical protein